MSITLNTRATSLHSQSYVQAVLRQIPWSIAKTSIQNHGVTGHLNGLLRILGRSPIDRAGSEWTAVSCSMRGCMCECVLRRGTV